MDGRETGNPPLLGSDRSSDPGDRQAGGASYRGGGAAAVRAAARAGGSDR